jgi:uncharacterized protein (TIGR02466 family)
MDYIIEQLFPTPIYVTVIDNLDEVQTEFNDVYSNIKFYDTGFDNWGRTHKISSPKFAADLIETHNLQKFLKTIDTHLRNYCNEIGFAYRNYQIRSWMTSFSRGEYSHIHTHPRVDISGVYYYKTSGDDGNIFFEPNNEISKNSVCFGKISDDWIHKPLVGKLILFPSYLRHGVTTNTSNFSLRHSVSFNIKFLESKHD